MNASPTTWFVISVVLVLIGVQTAIMAGQRNGFSDWLAWTMASLICLFSALGIVIFLPAPPAHVFTTACFIVSGLAVADVVRKGLKRRRRHVSAPDSPRSPLDTKTTP